MIRIAIRQSLPRLSLPLARWWRNARTRRQLADLPPHLLHDIGVSRDEAEREAARAFWDG